MRWRRAATRGGRASYDAFISYSRRADEKIARTLHRGLQGFTKPWYRAKALRVFRDDSSLSANPGLWSSIQAALERSDFLVLVASVDAASSDWVEREVVHWLAHHDPSHLLIVLTDGEIVWDAPAGDFDQDATTALPPALHGRFREEPRHVDLRWARHGELSPSLPQLTEAVADLAAPMHGRAKDELIGEDVRQHRRTVRLARTAIAAIAGLALLAGAAAAVAVDQRDDARGQRDRAEYQERVAVSRQLAAQALADVPEQPDRALLLGLESLKAHAGPHGLDALLTALQRVWTARAFLANDAPVLSLAYSPDGATLATGHNDRTIRLWHVASARPLGVLPATHQQFVQSLAFSPRGDVLAAVDRGGAVVLHHLATPTLPGRSFGTSVLAVAFSPDGARLATAGSVGDVRVWDVATGREVGPPLAEPAARVHQLAWSPDGGLLGVVTADGTVRLSDAATGQVVARPLAGTDVVVRSLAFSPDGATVALGRIDGTIVLWDRVGGRERGLPLSGHTAAVLSLAFNLPGTFLASGSADQTVIAWDLRTGTPGPPYRGHGDAVRAVAFRPDGQEIASGGFDGSLVLWQPDSRLVTPITSNEQDLRSVAYSADLTRLVFGYGNGNLHVWEMPGTAPSGGPMRLGGHVPATLAVSPNGELAASGDGQGTFVLWDLRERRAVGEPLRSPETVVDLFILHAFLVTGQAPGSFPTTFEKLLFSPDGSRLATVSYDNQIVLWDTGNGRPVGAPLAGNAGPVASLAFSPDGTLLASGDLTGQVVIWDVATARQRGAPLTGPTLLVESLAFAPNGATLGTGLADGSVVLWDVEARRPVGEPLRGHSSSVVNLAFGRDATVLATGGSDGSVLLWDVATQQLLGEPVIWHNTPVQALVFAPDGTRMATGSSDGTAYWDVDPSSWAAIACAIANRNLSQAEWTQLFDSRPYEPTCAQM